MLLRNLSRIIHISLMSQKSSHGPTTPISPVTTQQTRLSKFFLTTPSGSRDACSSRKRASDACHSEEVVTNTVIAEIADGSKISKNNNDNNIEAGDRKNKIKQIRLDLDSSIIHDVTPNLSEQLSIQDHITSKDDTSTIQTVTTPQYATPSLTPEQIKKVEENKNVALEKRKKSSLFSTMSPSWRQALRNELCKAYTSELATFLEEERQSYTIYPSHGDMFSWSNCCNIHDVKVVILGQDPYHGPGQAHGLAFSVNKGVAIPPSLANIYKELKCDISGFTIPKHGYLNSWGEQGVLLLNTCLSVRKGVALSHKGRGWEKLTDAIISWISHNSTNVVFLLWGKPAQEKSRIIDQKKHHILKCAHPSPFSADRGFFGCKHFSATNALLSKHGLRPINWNSLSD